MIKRINNCGHSILQALLVLLIELSLGQKMMDEAIHLDAPLPASGCTI